MPGSAIGRGVKRGAARPPPEERSDEGKRRCATAHILRVVQTLPNPLTQALCDDCGMMCDRGSERYGEKHLYPVIAKRLRSDGPGMVPKVHPRAWLQIRFIQRCLPGPVTGSGQDRLVLWDCYVLERRVYIRQQFKNLRSNNGILYNRSCGYL